MVEVITGARALELLRAEVEKAGKDFVYQQGDSGSCDYVRDGEPSCLVGKALHAYGVDIDTLQSFDDVGGILEVFDRMRPEFLSREAADVFAAGQYEQDMRSPWGTALRVAESKALDLGVAS